MSRPPLAATPMRAATNTERRHVGVSQRRELHLSTRPGSRRPPADGVLLPCTAREGTVGLDMAFCTGIKVAG